jgi:hypothetical protein
MGFGSSIIGTAEANQAMLEFIDVFPADQVGVCFFVGAICGGD